MNADKQLQQILKWGEGADFLDFANADGKRWLMPVRHMRTAMGLYQPSGPKGKLVKVGLPLLYWNPAALRVLHAERRRLALNDELRGRVEQAFGVKDPDFAVFGGTPGVHRKLTLQVGKEGRIAGYVKVTASEDIFRLFKQEQRVLDLLRRQGLDAVPECRDCGTLSGGLHVFMQTTVKTRRSKVLHRWTERHDRFLLAMEACTHRQMPFEASDFCRDLLTLEACLPLVDDRRELLARCLHEVKAHYAGKTVDFSAYHADFTPWNMFGTEKGLFVFDWEYARLSYPPGLDFFHFLIQTGVFEEHLTPERLFMRCRQQSAARNWGAAGADFALKCYLLAVMSLYVGRERNEPNGLSDNTRNMLGLWLDLLERLAVGSDE